MPPGVFTQGAALGGNMFWLGMVAGMVLVGLALIVMFAIVKVKPPQESESTRQWMADQRRYMEALIRTWGSVSAALSTWERERHSVQQLKADIAAAIAVAVSHHHTIHAERTYNEFLDRLRQLSAV
jgi:hypothetical protein